MMIFRWASKNTRNKIEVQVQVYIIVNSNKVVNLNKFTAGNQVR